VINYIISLEKATKEIKTYITNLIIFVSENTKSKRSTAQATCFSI